MAQRALPDWPFVVDRALYGLMDKDKDKDKDRDRDRASSCLIMAKEQVLSISNSVGFLHVGSDLR